MSNPPDTQPTCILIIDDEWMNRELLSTILTANDFAVIEASNGEKGLRIAKDQQPDLILLDVRMPDMNGYTVCRHLKQDTSTQTIPVIMITGLEEDSERKRAQQAGATALINRFLPMSDLLATVKAHLSTLP